ncbi:hypothetical protein [Ferribacterium limneticum]|uniref:hypothetical protein n=1 Tax=Ferribacterium limneticum TaxID=76259 RepID=UPI001CFAFB6F|nr:hypothetical protein [Ferribacterium limneticum]UCV17569.1 hypothetical protein KI610_12100 [Ferribacterium limneticum]
MRGFLHQLATRSLGLAPQIKSRAALPYAAPPADFAHAEAASHQAPPASAAIERPGLEQSPNARRSEQVADNALPAPIVADNTEPAARLETQTSMPSIGQPPRIAARQSPEGALLDRAPDRQATPPTGKTAASQLTAEQKPVPHHPEPGPAARHPAENAQAAVTDLESLVTRLLSDQSSHPEKSPETATPPAVITQRQASPRPAAISAVRPQASREHPATTPETDSAPEVHITIGRLEVNPPSRPAPAAQPPRPRGPAPLSLSDYLARRHGGRS